MATTAQLGGLYPLTRNTPDGERAQINKMFEATLRIIPDGTSNTANWGDIEGSIFDQKDLIRLIELIAGRKEVKSVSTSPYTVLSSDGVLLVDDDTIGGAATVNLLAASTAGSKFEVVVMKVGSTGNVTIDAAGSDLINGEATVDLVAQYESIRLASNGSNWFIIEA